MIREGHIVDFTHQGCTRWVVVKIYDCRATIIPMTGKNPNDPSEVFEESHPSATGISPNSECKTYGYVKGQIRKREQKKIVIQPILVVEKLKKSQIMLEALPSIPEDPSPMDQVMASVLTSTRGLFSSKDR